MVDSGIISPKEEGLALGSGLEAPEL